MRSPRCFLIMTVQMPKREICESRNLEKKLKIRSHIIQELCMTVLSNFRKEMEHLTIFSLNMSFHDSPVVIR